MSMNNGELLAGSRHRFNETEDVRCIQMVKNPQTENNVKAPLRKVTRSCRLMILPVKGRLIG